MAAALSEEGRYGLSCGRGTQDKITVLHVKLTETACRALENYQNTKNSVTSHPTIKFQGPQGCIKIPKSDSPNDMSNFSFYMSNVGKDNPQGSFDCIQQTVTSPGVSKLNCMGFIQEKITVRATNDSYQLTRDRMTQAEEETRSRSTKVIKPGGPYVGKRVQIRKPASSILDTAPERKRSTPINPASTIRKTNLSNSIAQRPYRERVIHLLALKPYKKPEILARLHRDGVNQKDKNSLSIILPQVANLNPKDNSYTLKDFVYKEIQRDWPGYLEGDKQLLDRVLSRKLNQSQSGTNQSDSPSNAASSSPSQKRVGDTDFIDPLMTKKPRISHLTNRVPPTLNGHLSLTSEKPAALPPPSAATPAPPPLPPARLPVSNPQTINSNSNSPSTPEGRGTQDLPVDSFSQSRGTYEDQQEKYTSRTSVEESVPTTKLVKSEPMDDKNSSLHKKAKKAKKTKDKERKKLDSETTNENPQPHLKKELEKMEEIPSPDTNQDSKEACTASDPSSTTVLPDYMVKYTVVASKEQRERYKEDFNSEYEEYRRLHSKIESVTRKFVHLDTQRKTLSPSSKEYKVIHEEVLKEYRKLKESLPNYYEEKCRCEYLHNKLAHIKRLIGEFDQRRAESSWH
ncbi:RNA polymerase II elongation factor ELL2 [Pelobates cultripes]|uniref:RNA polymerase II elongation factor ELL2 n=1 Tax=Pelobates cultripes TaxID=61616 RepID=A0AAD1W926_PELCU|nr:RNA polymerase II elongation factor ELL2 [Pelobates cultripes]CAH2297056.1 RNA polymerase II elongation factor ELL2 [Pelobates cultripes]